jgi:hypothetical protein
MIEEKRQEEDRKCSLTTEEREIVVKNVLLMM